MKIERAVHGDRPRHSGSAEIKGRAAAAAQNEIRRGGVNGDRDLCVPAVRQACVASWY